MSEPASELEAVLATCALDAAVHVALPGTAPSRVLANADKYLDWLNVKIRNASPTRKD